MISNKRRPQRGSSNKGRVPPPNHSEKKHEHDIARFRLIACNDGRSTGEKKNMAPITDTIGVNYDFYDY